MSIDSLAHGTPRTDLSDFSACRNGWHRKPKSVGPRACGPILHAPSGDSMEFRWGAAVAGSGHLRKTGFEQRGPCR
jgi:hypothetical protein